MQKKSIIIFAIIGILLIVTIFIIIFSGNKRDELNKTYKNISNNANFTFTMEEIESDISYKVSMLQKGEDMCIDMYTENEHNSTLVIQNQAYYIMHDEKEYYSFKDDDVETDVFISGIKNVLKNEYETGKENIDGKVLYYEEYDNENLEFILYANVNEMSKAKIRFYFENGKLAYIKNIIIDEHGDTIQELLRITIKYDVDENLFTIPEEYAEV